MANRYSIFEVKLVLEAIPKNRNLVQDTGRAEETTAGVYGNILRIGFSALTMRLGQRAFLKWPLVEGKTLPLGLFVAQRTAQA